MGVLENLIPEKRLDNLIKQEIEKGNYKTARTTKEGLRKEFLSQNRQIQRQYNKDKAKIKRNIRLAIGLTAITLVGTYTYANTPKQERYASKVEANIQEEEKGNETKGQIQQEQQDMQIQGLEASADEKTVNEELKEPMLEDLCNINTGKELDAYTAKIIVNIYNQENPDNPIDVNSFKIERSYAHLIATKDRFKNVISYETYKGDIKENQEIANSQHVIRFKIDDKLISILHEKGIQVKDIGEYDFSEFTELLSTERYLAYQLENGQTKSETDKYLIRQGQEKFIKIVKELREKEEEEKQEEIKYGAEL